MQSWTGKATTNCFPKCQLVLITKRSNEYVPGGHLVVTVFDPSSWMFPCTHAETMYSRARGTVQTAMPVSEPTALLSPGKHKDATYSPSWGVVQFANPASEPAVLVSPGKQAAIMYSLSEGGAVQFPNVFWGIREASEHELIQGAVTNWPRVGCWQAIGAGALEGLLFEIDATMEFNEFSHSDQGLSILRLKCDRECKYYESLFRQLNQHERFRCYCKWW